MQGLSGRYTSDSITHWSTYKMGGNEWEWSILAQNFQKTPKKYLDSLPSIDFYRQTVLQFFLPNIQYFCMVRYHSQGSNRIANNNKCLNSTFSLTLQIGLKPLVHFSPFSKGRKKCPYWEVREGHTTTLTPPAQTKDPLTSDIWLWKQTGVDA